MINVILDTNFLIYCAKNKLDYKEEISSLLNEDFKLVTPKQVVDELKKLMNDRYGKVSFKDKSACKLALQLLEFYNVKIINVSGKNVDNAILKLAFENNKNIVATLDKEMRNKLPRVILINKYKKLILAK
ncbi:MAG: hypothetical protein QXW97_02790 [Candidatus Pacearchaeota archaeon]